MAKRPISGSADARPRLFVGVVEGRGAYWRTSMQAGAPPPEQWSPSLGDAVEAAMLSIDLMPAVLFFEGVQ